MSNVKKSVPVIYGSNWLPFSILVKLFTWTWTNHCGLISEDGKIVYEARLFYGVVETPMDEFRKRYKKAVIRDTECDNPEEAYRFVRSKLGCGYDILGALGIGLRLPFFDRESHFSCAELLAQGGVGNLKGKIKRILASPKILWQKRIK